MKIIKYILAIFMAAYALSSIAYCQGGIGIGNNRPYLNWATTYNGAANGVNEFLALAINPNYANMPPQIAYVTGYSSETTAGFSCATFSYSLPMYTWRGIFDLGGVEAECDDCYRY